MLHPHPLSADSTIFFFTSGISRRGCSGRGVAGHTARVRVGGARGRRPPHAPRAVRAVGARDRRACTRRWILYGVSHVSVY